MWSFRASVLCLQFLLRWWMLRGRSLRCEWRCLFQLGGRGYLFQWGLRNLRHRFGDVLFEFNLHGGEHVMHHIRAQRYLNLHRLWRRQPSLLRGSLLRRRRLLREWIQWHHVRRRGQGLQLGQRGPHRYLLGWRMRNLRRPRQCVLHGGPMHGREHHLPVCDDRRRSKHVCRLRFDGRALLYDQCGGFLGHLRHRQCLPAFDIDAHLFVRGLRRLWPSLLYREHLRIRQVSFERKVSVASKQSEKQRPEKSDLVDGCVEALARDHPAFAFMTGYPCPCP